MNIFKKIFCRIYQLGFKIILPFLPYKKPNILKKEEEIPALLKNKNLHKILIVTDKGIVKAGLVQKLTNILDLAYIEYVIYDNTVPNPTINNVEEAYQIYLENNLQAIIAVGGGSSMDLAKIVGARVVRPQKTVEQMKGLLKINKKLPLLIAIPTTAGTGSEITITAVISNQDTHHKYPINDFCLIPAYAVLDYSNTVGLPKSITSTTGMDALTHAIEAYIGKTRTKETKKMSLEATKLIVENILECYHNPNHKEARQNMLLASHYAGISFTKAYVGYVHAIAHTLGGKYNVPHGLANAIILPIMLEEYGKKIHKKMKKLSVYANLADAHDSKEVACKKLIDWIYQTNQEMMIPNKIAEIQEEDIDSLAALASAEANPLYPVPKLMDKKELKKMYLKIKGR